ncbi:hypothetical protein [Actinoplanes sp. NPDC051851]|uniref:hypothetical protein n=1 Tax=Actinoplanes sp. NPDC051851 TaxID=3154753 RepID=UPI00343E7FE2
MRIAVIPTALLVLPLFSCTAEPAAETAAPTASTAAPAASPSGAPAELMPPSAVPGELARYEFDGTLSNSIHSTTKPKADTEYVLKAVCAGTGTAFFTMSEGGKDMIARLEVNCTGAPAYAGVGVGTDLPGPPIQVDMTLTEDITSAWAVLAPDASLG